jgi:hypothetical protein
MIHIWGCFVIFVFGSTVLYRIQLSEYYSNSFEKSH